MCSANETPATDASAFHRSRSTSSAFSRYVPTAAQYIPNRSRVYTDPGYLREESAARAINSVSSACPVAGPNDGIRANSSIAVTWAPGSLEAAPGLMRLAARCMCRRMVPRGTTIRLVAMPRVYSGPVNMPSLPPNRSGAMFTSTPDLSRPGT